MSNKYTTDAKKHSATLTLPTNPLTLASGEVALKLVGGVTSQVDVVVVVSVGPQERQGEVGVDRTMEDGVQSLVGGIQAILDGTHTLTHGEGAEDSCEASVRGHRVAESCEPI